MFSRPCVLYGLSRKKYRLVRKETRTSSERLVYNVLPFAIWHWNSYIKIERQLQNANPMLAYSALNFADHYLLFDFPGQVELFFLHSSAKNVIMKLIKKLNLRVWFGLCVQWMMFLASTRCLNNSNDLCLLSLWVPCLKQLVAVHLVDAHLCSDPGKYVSALLLSLSTMLHMELPHVNVLSKIDLIENYGKLGMYAAFLFRSGSVMFMKLILLATVVHPC